jgi:hypothetical protein
VHTRVLLTLGIALIMTVALWAEPPERILLREAQVLQKSGDLAGFVAKLEAVRQLNPDYPRGLLLLARGYAATNRPADAMATLQSLAAMGLTHPIERDKAFSILHGLPGLADLAKNFAANAAPKGEGRIAFELPAREGIIESLAVDSHGNWYFGDARERCIWRRDVAGNLSRFSAAENLSGVFGLKLDEKTGTLWAATAALPEMRGYTEADKGRAALVAIDLASGQVRRTYSAPADGREHVFGDVLLASDGTVYVSDSGPAVIWRLVPGAADLEMWLDCDHCVNLQGMVESADHRSLIFADYLTGLWRADLASKALDHFPSLPDQTLHGLDSLYAVPGGLIATQNGTQPQRVVRLSLDATGRPSALRVLETGHPDMNDLSLGTVSDDRFFFIGNSGWALFGQPDTAPAPRPVKIFQTKL